MYIYIFFQKGQWRYYREKGQGSSAKSRCLQERHLHSTVVTSCSIYSQRSQYGQHSQLSQEYDQPHPKIQTEVRSVELVSKSMCFFSLYRKLQWQYLHCPCGQGETKPILRFQSHPHLLKLSAAIGLIIDFPWWILGVIVQHPRIVGCCRDRLQYLRSGFPSTHTKKSELAQTSQ